MEDSLNSRLKAMEDMFYIEQDKKLIENLKSEMAAEENREALSAASGISDAAVIDALIGIGLSPESLTSLSMIPLVAVAWADNKLEDSEKAAILQAADVAGITSGSASYAVMQAWLDKQPSGELLESWKAYIHALKESLEETAYNQLKSSILSRSEAVAESAGGFLGLGNKVSGSERKVLDELAAAFN